MPSSNETAVLAVPLAGQRRILLAVTGLTPQVVTETLYALSREGGKWRPEQELDFTPGGAHAELLRSARAAGLLAWDEQTQVVFHDCDAAQYLGGGWIEEYAGLNTCEGG